MKTIIVWFRNDLRVHDHPALARAAADADRVIPVFILDKSLLSASANRTKFLLECLKDLKQSLKDIGGDLVIESGQLTAVLKKLAKDYDASAVYYTSDFVPYAVKRDKKVEEALEKENIEFKGFTGRLIVSALSKITTKTGKPYTVFTPFWRNWQQIGRRDIADVPRQIKLPSSINVGTIPSLDSLNLSSSVSKDALPGGETASRKRLDNFLHDGIKDYHNSNNEMAADGTSRLSSYLHFGCVSPREIETLLPNGKGAEAWHRQLCWRDFYHYVILHHPKKTQEFQEKYRSFTWSHDKKKLDAWKEGKTGFPVVDAAMRQLNQEGWMHNRARLIVGSFLTKDLWIDWRDGEAYFMEMLTDGDTANNNGNWQWIASVGVDPAPVFRRLYNPASQQKNYDPNGEYIRRYIPELKDVPTKYLGEPWTMSEDEQKEYNCVIGTDYPEPIVDHKKARQETLERFSAANSN